MIPVYIINGFLDSGKTEFITYTLTQPYFQADTRTLVIVCEEGENSYEEKLLAQNNVSIEYLEEEAELTAKTLIELEKKHKAKRVIIEWNGMWNMKDLKLPWHWKVEQQVTCICGQTFSIYFNNMKSLLSEMIRKSELIVLNRCDGVNNLTTYKRNLMAINQKAEIIFEDKNGEINVVLDEDLPYNLESDLLSLNDFGYGIWYIDMLDNPDRYIGKTVEFIANVLIPEKFPKGYFVPGRVAMTCCADDMTFLGFACQYEGSSELTQKEWVKVRATVHREFFADYNGEGPVLHAVSVEKTTEPKEAVINFA